ncbi:MAG: ribosome assembly factor SBDS [Nanoarchaeota archaeon]|nr:ribosome assembly factor SBDS [Nanoarchaeota archaeon]
MTQTTARIKKNGLNFEILVDMEDALKFKKGETDFLNIEGDRIFSDVKKGNVPSNSDLEIAFKTTNTLEIGKIIIKQGEILVNQDHRDEEKEKKIKQVVDFLSRNAIDPQSGNPISPERIKNALNDSHVQIKNTPVENQVKDILEALSKIIPIKVETKKVKITIPAVQTGKVYGLITQYKEKEEWLNNGDLEVIVSVPAGLIIDFYDKLNSATSGSALTEEMND